MNTSNFKRHAERHLQRWKEAPNRKPLIMRGARQVGKTTLVEDFSKAYKNRIMLNLENEADIKFFELYQDVTTMKDALFLENGIPNKDIASTLLFIDEIQESPKAIKQLRYFYEKLPELHIIAAGSLLEFVMSEVISFPVGRVEYLYLYPLNFAEFLMALNKQEVLKQLDKVPLNDFAHDQLMRMFNTYTIIGGMPEVVKTYITRGSIADMPRVYESIWTSYKNDIEKYTKSDAERRVIGHIMSVAHLYLGQRIKFQNFGNSNYRSREVSEAFRNLDAAKIIQLMYPTTDVEVPVKPDMKKAPKLQFLDTGLINYELKIQAELLALDDLSFAFKGAILPHIIMQELISLNAISIHKPNFWVRKKAQASAEVDLVYSYRNRVIPIEFKAGTAGKMKSLHEFIERTNHNYAIRMYAGKFSIEKHTTPKTHKPYTLMSLPYYLGTKLPEYVEYLVMNY
ncbi:MAG: ATP-binding protein [Bacteroidales bacterium]